MVGLNRAGRDETRGIQPKRVADKELEFPGFVAAEGEAGEVVALQQDSWTPPLAAERATQPRRLGDRSREGGETKTRQP
jgi:hypothetical protein